MKKNILVNATSLASGGAFTILNQYIDQLLRKEEDDKTYYIFVPDTFIIRRLRQNIHYIKNSKNYFYKSRNYWNAIGMKKWCKANEVNIYELYSMQNYYPFGFNKMNIFKRLYLHQSIPFYEYKWSIFKKNERPLWFYKNIYYFLIKRSIRQSDKIIVQTEWFKRQIINKTKIDEKRIAVEKPIIDRIQPSKYNAITTIKGKIKLFYPASGHLYKNHLVLYKAMDILVNEYKEKEIMLYLTLGKKDDIAQKYIKKFNLDENVILLDEITYEQVMSYYKSVDVLLFPSKIETFGLPLIEAEKFNLSIIAGNLELYREVIGEYLGKVIYCDCDDAKEWADAIKSLIR